MTKVNVYLVLGLLGFACAAPGASGGADGDKLVDLGELPPEHVAEDPETGDQYVDIAALDEETRAAFSDDESLASDDPILALISDPEVEPRVDDLLAAIEIEDRAAYDAIVDTFSESTRAAHDFDAFFSAVYVDTAEESLASSGCSDFFEAAHGTDYCWECTNYPGRCQSKRHFPCNGDHRNGTFYERTRVSINGRVECRTRTYAGAVQCLGPQGRNECTNGGQACGAAGFADYGVWLKSKQLD
jgi:hypothetical protein